MSTVSISGLSILWKPMWENFLSRFEEILGRKNFSTVKYLDFVTLSSSSRLTDNKVSGGKVTNTYLIPLVTK